VPAGPALIAFHFGKAANPRAYGGALSNSPTPLRGGGPGLSTVPRSEFAPASNPDPKERTPFTGLIDELALFDVALTPEQVRRLAGK
jgi:hypothetical protein